MDLGYKDPNMGVAPAVAGDTKTKESPPTYPGLTIRGEAAKQLQNGYAVGDEFEATVKCKVVEIRDAQRTDSRPWSDGPSCELEITELDAGEMGKPELGEETADDALEDFRAKRARPAEEED